MTFYEFILSRKASDTPRGDFVGDVKRDRDFPKDVADWDRLHLYLSMKAGSNAEAVLKAAKPVWRAYEREVGKLA